MNVRKCDVCGVTSDERPRFPETNDWRSLDVRAAKDWRASYTSVGGGIVRERDDSWPGGSRWQGAWQPTGAVLPVHFCSEGCMFNGLCKLHDGATVEAFSGFRLPTEVLIDFMREFTTTGEREALTTEVSA